MDQAGADLAATAIEAALAAGATYADARFTHERGHHVGVRDEHIESVDHEESRGLGVRALVGSSWGFAAAADPTEVQAGEIGGRAAAVAAASGRVPGPPLHLADVEVHQAHYETPVAEDPFEVSVTDKAELLIAATVAMRAAAEIEVARASMRSWDTRGWFISSQGHRISQHLVRTGGGMDATTADEDQSQRRSYPQSFGQYEAGGFEVIRSFDLVANAPRLAEEAEALLTAPLCPGGTTDVILEGSQLALQLHESVGHAIELDRILGWEAAFAGTSFLDLDQLGSLQYGSPLMNIVADSTLPGALATYGFDDEGTPAQRVPIVDEGIWVGALTGRDSAHLAGVSPGGMVRAESWNRLPIVRMTNVGMLPGDSSLDEIVADTSDGILMATNRSWSIDDRRLNFQFGCEIAWEIKNGRRGRMLRNPTYTGITPTFWAGLDRLAGEPEWRAWGVPNCGKGQPMQVMWTGHMASPARFRNVRVGVSA